MNGKWAGNPLKLKLINKILKKKKINFIQNGGTIPQSGRVYIKSQFN